MRDWIGSVFTDDGAATWARTFVADGDGLPALRHALNVAAGRPEDEDLELHEAQEALAAAEVVAAAAGQPAMPDAYPDGLLRWAAAHSGDADDPLRSLARTAVTRLAGERSELSDRWATSGDLREWHLTIETLLLRLGRD